MKKKLLIFFILNIIHIVPVFASDYHQNGQSHRVVYTILDSSGKPVSGQTVKLSIERSIDSKFYDFNDSAFKSSGWTTRLATMNYDAIGEHYYTVITLDNGGIISGDYACTISNDSAVYSDHQTEVVEFDSLAKLVKINR